MPIKTLTSAAIAHKKVKQKSISKLKKDADKWCSIYVRQSAANQEGIAECYTCGKRDYWNKLQCGHFVPRHHSATRFDLSHLRVQCAGCNVWGRGQIAEFARKLLAEIGVKTYKATLTRAKTVHQFTRPEIEAIIEDFKKKVAGLESK